MGGLPMTMDAPPGPSLDGPARPAARPPWSRPSFYAVLAACVATLIIVLYFGSGANWWVDRVPAAPGQCGCATPCPPECASQVLTCRCSLPLLRAPRRQVIVWGVIVAFIPLIALVSLAYVLVQRRFEALQEEREMVRAAASAAAALARCCNFAFFDALPVANAGGGLEKAT